ncbi:MAG: hypothetical protein AAGI48_03955 [Verrucomicrobiota bacterium]
MPAKPKAVDGKAEVLTKGNALTSDLQACEDSILAAQEHVIAHTAAHRQAVLPHLLNIGLACLKAQNLFAMTPAERAKAGGKAKAASSALTKQNPHSPVSFAEWFDGSEIKGLSRPTVYNYMKAVKGLGLDHKATPRSIETKLQRLRKQSETNSLPAPSIARLGKKAEQEETDDAAKKPPKKTTRLGDAREAIQQWKDDWDEFVQDGGLEDLRATDLKNLKDFILTTRDQTTKAMK